MPLQGTCLADLRWPRSRCFATGLDDRLGEAMPVVQWTAIAADLETFWR
jgi:hypothetical protein